MSSKHAFRASFSSVAGGVGRTTSVLASAWSLSENGKRVIVVDLNFRSPFLLHSLPSETVACPVPGIADWLAKNTVSIPENIATVMSDERFIFVPACGTDSDDYVNQLSVAMARSNIIERLRTLLYHLEERFEPDLILIDAPAGLDNFSLSCMIELDVDCLFLFVANKNDIWRNYRILFQHWNTKSKTGMLYDIREKIQLVASMLPYSGTARYYEKLRENAWSLFIDHIYDRVPAGTSSGAYFSFDLMDREAPHYPLPIYSIEGLAYFESFRLWLHSLSDGYAVQHTSKNIAGELDRVFGDIIEYLKVQTS